MLFPAHRQSSHRPPPGRRGGWQRQAMSLVEIMVAMTILTIILGFVTAIVWQVQKVTTAARSQTEIYEQARILFDLVTQDVQALQANSQSGSAITWCLYPSGSIAGIPATQTPQLALVSASGVGAAFSDKERLVEVIYSLGSDSSLTRYVTSQGDGATWNFFNSDSITYPNGYPTSEWMKNPPKSATVATGVASFTVAAFSTISASTASTYATNSDTNTVPAMFRVEFELYNPNAPTAAQIDASRRKFTKNIFLARGQ